MTHEQRIANGALGGRARARNLTREAIAEIGRAGALARVAATTPEQRREFGRRAAAVRWAKRKENGQ